VYFSAVIFLVQSVVFEAFFPFLLMSYVSNISILYGSHEK